MKKAPFVNKKYLLEKFPGKGGWTYALIPEIKPDKQSPFGWVKVNGSIDDYTFEHYHLMPFGKGILFLPVKAAIRKKIKKYAGDYVHVILYADDTLQEMPEELKLCLQDEPNGMKNFLAYPETEQQLFIEWIQSARNEEIKVKRIAKTLDAIEKKLTCSAIK